MRIKKIAERRTIWGGGRRRRKSAARWTRATARRRNGPRRSTTSLGDLRGRAAAPHGGPSRGSLIHNIDEGTALPASSSRAPPRPQSAVIRERLVTRAPAPRRRRASREGRRRRPSRPRGRRPKHTAAPPRAHHAFDAHRAALRRYGDGREQPQERGARRLDRLHLPGGAGAQQRRPGLGHGRVRSCSPSPLDLTSGGPARGLHAPPGPNGLLQGRHVPPALLPPHRPLTPRVVSSLPPALIRSCSRDTPTMIS